MMKAFDPISHSINHHASQPRLNARESVCLIFYDFVSTIPTVAMIILYEHTFYLSIAPFPFTNTNISCLHELILLSIRYFRFCYHRQRLLSVKIISNHVMSRLDKRC